MSKRSAANGDNLQRIVGALDFTSWFYRNCRTQRRKGAKICGECPFRAGIEAEERRRANDKAQL